jgi:ribosomal protein S18 acetylase RimI-like enzyme
MGIDEAAGQQSAIRNPQSAIGLEVLRPESVRGLRLPWLSRFNRENLTAHLRENPGLSLRAVGSDEYIVGERWRRREDIANIVEVVGRRSKRALVEGLVERLEAGGARLVLVAADVWRDEPALYSGLGFSMLERIVFFERDIPARHARGDRDWEEGLPTLDITRASVADLDLLLELDHVSFPWLWWNSRDEMGTYLLMEDVWVFVARAGGEPVGYASFTMYNGWAHLDRLAVAETHQRKGYGAAQLAHVLRAMQAEGARTVGLSTQEQNVQSHRLYRRFDFRLGREAMGIYGRWTVDGGR